ncbi:DUF3108 domain-containing protein [Falsirhodobacter sp. alg1]|uniref:DUF3108 domain-containing protein n=1 Tax=Falsirhodobacter sp. alg1 TaxID=1472418 RepID=UPI0005EE9DCB|nr:DUF3108 domain-containing protein [Falsirhodobacter sp. alg1]
MRKILTLCFAAAITLGPLPAVPQTAGPALYSLTIRGVTAGSLRVSGQIESGRYAISGMLQSGGLVGILRSIRYDAATQGRFAADRFTPESYSERSDNNGRQRSATMTYRAGVPQVKAYTPPRAANENDVDPATQGGSVDPLTALYATLRDVPAGEECSRSLRIFDGRRSTELALSRPVRRGDTVTCNGEYRRVDGYSPQEMAEKTTFPFTLQYEAIPGNMMRVTQVTTDTIYGAARLTRR